MNTLSDEQLKELREQYEANGLNYIKYIEGPVTFNDGTQDQILTVSEVSFLVRLHNAFPAILSTIQSLRTELAAAKEDLALTKFRLKAADQGLQQLDEENARFRIALTEIASYDKEKKHGDGICPYGCDTPFIAQRALSQPPQSPWRPKFKVGDKVLIGIESKVNEIDEIWQPDTSKSPAYHLKGKGYFTEGDLSPAPQPPTKGEES